MAEPPVELLLAELKNPGNPPNMKWALMTVLETHRCTEAVPLLVDLLRDEPVLMDEASRALKALTGRDAGEDADQWTAALGAPGSTNEDTREGENQSMVFVRDALQDEDADITWDEEQACVYTEIHFEERRQQVIISFGSEDALGQRCAQLYTECGTIGPEWRDEILARSALLRYGSFALEEGADGAFRVTMQHFLPEADLAPADLRDAIVVIAHDADALEHEITGEDRI